MQSESISGVQYELRSYVYWGDPIVFQCLAHFSTLHHLKPVVCSILWYATFEIVGTEWRAVFVKNRHINPLLTMLFGNLWPCSWLGHFLTNRLSLSYHYGFNCAQFCQKSLEVSVSETSKRTVPVMRNHNLSLTWKLSFFWGEPYLLQCIVHVRHHLRLLLPKLVFETVWPCSYKSYNVYYLYKLDHIFYTYLDTYFVHILCTDIKPLSAKPNCHQHHVLSVLLAKTLFCLLLRWAGQWWIECSIAQEATISSVNI